MRATLVSRSGDRATVRLAPGWLGRLLGAVELEVELARWTPTGVWLTEATRPRSRLRAARRQDPPRAGLRAGPAPPRAVARDFVDLRR